MLKKAGPDGVGKVVNEFTAVHPELSKRQTEMKIAEVAVKEKKGDDVKQVWHIRPEFEHYLTMENFYDGQAPAQPAKGAKSGPKEKASSSSSSSGGAAKRKREDDDDDGDSGPKGKGGSTPTGGREPKKAKHAFGFFVKAKRAEAEVEVGDASVRTYDALATRPHP
jgi:hypothetical protein